MGRLAGLTFSRGWIPSHPRFRLRWLANSDADVPSWIDDDRWVPTGNRALYRRVKDGIRAVLTELDADGPVLMPTFIPPGVPATVEEIGLESAFFPVEPTLSVSLDVVRERIEATDPAVVIVVHYLGLVDPAFPEIRELTRETGAYLIEDVARGLFSRDADGVLLGSTGDAALFCVNKTLPGPNGGLIISRETALPSPVDRCPETLDLTREVFRYFMANFDTSVLVSDPDEDRDIPVGVPADELLAPGWVSVRGFDGQSPETVQSLRLALYRDLRERLVDVAPVVTPSAPDGASPYGVGIVTSSGSVRDELYRTLAGQGLPAEIISWPPNFEEMSTEEGATALRRRLLVIPTHQQVPSTAGARIESVVRDVLAE